MATYSCYLGNLMAINSASCSIGPGSSTQGTYSTFLGPSAGISAAAGSTNVVSIGGGSDVGSITTDSVAVGYQCTVGASANAVALGAGSFSNTPGTFVIGSPSNPLIPVAYYSPYTHYHTIYTYTAGKNFTTDTSLGAAPMVNGILLFNIPSAASVTLPTSAQCFAQLHDYITGSYVWGYMTNGNTGSAALTIAHSADTNYFGPTSLSAGYGVRFVVKVNGSAIDYIM